MKKAAKLYRMVTDEHICPFGIKSKDLLERNGYKVEDIHLKSREETDKFKEKHSVKTTPQTFIGEKKVGGYDDLRSFFGKPKEQNQDGVTYKPIVAIFSVTFLLALAVNWYATKQLFSISMLELFISFSMCVLAIQKLRDLFSFTNQFITYDLLAMRNVRYAYFYPFAEAAAGLSMTAKVGLIVSSPLAIFIGTIGAVSVIKAVYIDKRDLKCACVGGNSNVPLGFISLTENIMMIAMGVWMLI